jgi:RNA-directed DNA polymerase
MSRTDSVRVEAATAHSSIFAWPRGPRKTSKRDGKRHDTPYQWVVEGDIKGCFEHIDHHLLMNHVRQHCVDRRVNRLLVQFLKAGALSEEQFLRTEAGTPQGGIISPLLANIALSIIRPSAGRTGSCDGITAAMEARSSDRRAGRAVYFPVRYADDFIVLVSGAAEDAAAEREELATVLQQGMGLTLSPEKTRASLL